MLADSRFSPRIVAIRLSLRLSLPIVFDIGQNGVSYEGERSNGSFSKGVGLFHLRGGVRWITRRLCSLTFKVCVHALVRYREALNVAFLGM